MKLDFRKFEEMNIQYDVHFIDIRFNTVLRIRSNLNSPKSIFYITKQTTKARGKNFFILDSEIKKERS